MSEIDIRDERVRRPLPQGRTAPGNLEVASWTVCAVCPLGFVEAAGCYGFLRSSALSTCRRRSAFRLAEPSWTATTSVAPGVCAMTVAL